MMWGPGGWGMMGWGLGIALVLSLIVLALVVVGIALVVRSGGLAEPPGHERSRALDILDERFARGEIDLQEYEERRQVLLGQRR